MTEVESVRKTKSDTVSKVTRVKKEYIKLANLDNCIAIEGARQNNLKNISLNIPKDRFVVITGPSGSGKSSLAFDTIYAEGQRRYIESLSTYARQFLNIQGKPDYDSISGLSPAIAIDQKTTSKNPRSTVATMTEIYDYLRILYARVGVPFSPETNLPIKSITISEMIESLLKLPLKTKVNIIAPIVRGQKGEHKKLLLTLRKSGYERIKFNGELVSIDDVIMNIDKNRKNTIDVVVDRLEIKPDIKDRLASSVETAVKLSEGILHAEIVSIDPAIDESEIASINGTEIKESAILNFSEKFCCPVSGFTIEDMEPRIFSFNSPYGVCPSCNGVGTEYHFVPELAIGDVSLSIREGAITLWTTQASSKHYIQMLKTLETEFDFSIDEPFENINEKAKQMIFYGLGEREIEFSYNDGMRIYKVKKQYEGIMTMLYNRWRETDSEVIKEELQKFQDITKCRECSGYRLKKESLCIKINHKHIGEVCRTSISDSIIWFNDLHRHLNGQQNEIASKAVKEIVKRLGFLQNVGVGYLTLARESGTLSGGESQRIRLASQIGSELTGILYILDEPSIGLHQSDNEKLIRTIKNLRDIGNSVIVVEHDEETMEEADYIIDIGPGAGINGGYVIAEGTPAEIMANKNSITGAYLSGTEIINLDGRARRQLGNGQFLEIRGAKGNNLKNINVKIPLGMFVTITGVSGCGKSTLVMETIYRALAAKLYKSKVKAEPYDDIIGLENIEKVIEIDQSPIGRTPRSNPATYTGAFNYIRDWFSGLPEARRRGYKPARFSFNVKGGRCEACQGDGAVKVEMHFLPDVYVCCDICKGKRYNRETLEIEFKTKTISDVLEMSVDEALNFFKSVPLIKEKFQYLSDVGLGYMKLGQSATTLSGGESQRIKLAKELSRKTAGNCLYILDEPTTGLHSHDIKKLLDVLHRLIDQDNSMIVIEHNMDVIKTSDYVIDMGPEGGDKGGLIVACGTPEAICESPDSVTGKYLKKYLAKMQVYKDRQKAK